MGEQLILFPSDRGVVSPSVSPAQQSRSQSRSRVESVRTQRGSIQRTFPDNEELERMAETCALDVARRGGATLDEVAAILNVTRESIRQIELGALAKLHALLRDDAEADSSRGA